MWQVLGWNSVGREEMMGGGQWEHRWGTPSDLAWEACLGERGEGVGYRAVSGKQ